MSIRYSTRSRRSHREDQKMKNMRSKIYEWTQEDRKSERRKKPKEWEDDIMDWIDGGAKEEAERHLRKEEEKRRQYDEQMKK